jgi:site-specific DNA-methyltransferase (adenine-specific)
MKVENIKIADLIPYHNNPRINDGAVNHVASSISEFGFKVPIVIDDSNVIVTGHTRLKAAQKLGLIEVPCIQADDLTPAQIKAFRLADNKTSEFSVWDFPLLDAELEELKELGFDYDFGFINEEDFGEDFELPDGDKEPFQQITFTLADAQAELIKSALTLAKQDIDVETFGNENSNGNAIYRIVNEWVEQKK